jgi:hypothetical protein
MVSLDEEDNAPALSFSTSSLVVDVISDVEIEADIMLKPQDVVL